MKHLAILLVLSFAARAHAIEPWADPTIPVKDGLALWLDAMHDSHELHDGDAIEVLHDASGNHRDFSQPLAASRPQYHPSRTIRFDGKDDHLLSSTTAKPLKEFTAILVTAPKSNPGGFRAFLAGHQTGESDYTSGFTIDMGPEKSSKIDGFDQLNVEGIGFVGAHSLMDDAAPFEQSQCLIVTCAPGDDGVKLSVNGKPMGHRGRKEGEISIENLVLGARCYTNDAQPPSIRGFLNGDIAEVLLYDRVLTSAEQKSLNEYLVKKHPALAESIAAMQQTSSQLKRLENPPEIQMFVPGFSARKLPLDLTNINNLRYRPDGKLVALAYDGKVYLLTDTDNDGLEDHAETFWDNPDGKIAQPIGMTLTPPNYKHGQGLFIACKGKLSLVVDTNGDDKADKEIVVAQGWPGSFHGVDALGVAMDHDGTVYFGIGTSNFADPLLLDKEGKTHYDIKGERGTIIKVSPDLQHREIFCTGIRFPVGMAFNSLGDLFATDQEGATWVPNGNPLDELLHIQQGRHYGFPPRHPKHNPNIIDEPSTFDYAPQHQSTCGLFFDESVNGGPIFGPANWRGDALVCGSSRGKLYRTKLIKTRSGYVAQNQMIGSLPMLLIDSTVTPTGDLIVTTHSGNPDWGNGPLGKGKLYKISYREKDLPQPVKAWQASPSEVHIAFDRPIDDAMLKDLTKNISIDAGLYVGAGDRFETMRPGYSAVKRQLRAARQKVSVSSVNITPDRRTLILATIAQTQAVNYAVTLPRASSTTKPGEIAQVDAIDLAYDLTGVATAWQGKSPSQKWTGWLPHPDISVAKTFTAGSDEHDALWPMLRAPGTLTLRTSLNLWQMLHPAIQPGSQIDWNPQPENVTVTFASSAPIKLRSDGKDLPAASITVTAQEGELVPLEIILTTSDTDPTLNVSFTTNEDSRPRPLALRRFVLPWAHLKAQPTEVLTADDIPELKGGDWSRGREIYFGSEAGCSKCHQLRGKGSDVGPDLSNLIHRDYDSVMRDIREPSGALNPDYLASNVWLKNDEVLTGIMRKTGDKTIVRSGSNITRTLVDSEINRITPSKISMMPTGLAEGLGEAKMRDLMTFLITEPLQPAPLEHKGAPPARTPWSVKDVLKANPTTQTSNRKLNILLVSGTKDHGPGEHDYPLWRARWTKLLSMAENVTVAEGFDWPTKEQWAAADVAVFYSANPSWNETTAKDLDAFLARGGGLVLIHYAVSGQKYVEGFADRIGLAWKGAGSKFRHGELDLIIRDKSHDIMRGFDKLHFNDESYWNLVGDPKNIHVLADGIEEGEPRPLLWTVEKDKSRIFVSILGHFTWTFDDPFFRILLLRGICWTAHEPADRLSNLATVGARIGD